MDLISALDLSNFLFKLVQITFWSFWLWKVHCSRKKSCSYVTFVITHEEKQNSKKLTFLPLCILLFLLLLVCLSNNTGSRCPCIPSSCTSTHPLTLSCLSWNKKRRVRYVMKPGAFSVNLLFEDIFVWYLEIQLLKYFFFFWFPSWVSDTGW